MSVFLLGLAAVNVVLIFVLIAMPMGLRTFTLTRRFSAKPDTLRAHLHPLGQYSDWSGGIVKACWQDKDQRIADVAYGFEDRDGAPIRRSLVFDEEALNEGFAYRVSDDSSLSRDFWADYRLETVFDSGDQGTIVRQSVTDRYRGLAFYLYRYFARRRELRQLESYLDTGTFQKQGWFEHPATQFGFAGLSVLILWPFFGLHSLGLILAVILTSVVALHELGHMLAFRLMGHPTARMIFIPMLGGIAMGSRPYNSHFEIAFSAMMGAGFSAFLIPLGIVFAMTFPDFLYAQAIIFFVGVCALFNLANLVPVWKFDGGQVLRQIFRGQVSLAIASFLSLAILMLVAYHAGLSLSVIMVIGAIFVVLSLMTAGKGVKPRRPLVAMSWREKMLASTGFAAIFLTHSAGVIWFIDNSGLV